jgi:DNA repair and recombination RAD54-like protein
MQNELTEFYNMVDFCNPMVLGTISEFRKKYERPILRAKEMDASPTDKTKADALQKELSTIVNEFILKRGNILNAKFLPDKLVQYVCCKISPLQELLYEHILNSKEMRHIREGKQVRKPIATYSLTYLLTHSLTHSLTHLLTYSLTHSLTHLLTRSLTHSLFHGRLTLSAQSVS